MLPIELENIIFEYAVDLQIMSLQNELLCLIFAINGSGNCINTLLLGFCLTNHDTADYALICLEYCLETLENLLNGKGIVLGVIDSETRSFLVFRERHRRLGDYYNLLYQKSFHVLRSVIAPLQPLLRRVYYVIKDKQLSDCMTLKIRRKLSSIFCLNQIGLCRYFNCEVFEESTNRRLTETLLLNEIPNIP